jgi:hypothetical protein
MVAWFPHGSKTLGILEKDAPVKKAPHGAGRYGDTAPTGIGGVPSNASRVTKRLLFENPCIRIA